MKSKLIPILLTCACASLARADFNPVTLTANSYTFDIVVESNVVQSLPYCINVTAGNGTGLGDNTYYEQGLHSRPGFSGTNSGVPVHNTVFTNINNANMAFVMPPDYTTNNDLMIDTTFGSGTLTFNANATATNLVILGCGGGGATTVGWTVTHADTTTESGSTAFPDWFTGGATVAWGANGRITSGGGYNNYNASAVNNQAPYLYANQITVSGASPVVSIGFTFTSGQHANIFAVSGKAVGASTWTPIPLGGFNVMGLVPNAVPFPVTATMDQGTNLTQNGNLATWFEQGFVRSAPTAGLPPSGSIFNSQAQPTHHYQMGNYSANNGILIDTNHQIVNITPAVTTNLYSTFALLTAGGNVGGNNVMTNICILQHADGVNETNFFFGYDWFNSAVAPAYIANGRVNMSGRSANNVNNNNPRLFESYFPLNDPGSPVTNIVVKYFTATGASATTFIMAVSASAGGVAPLITSGALPATQTWFPTQTANFTVLVSGTAPVTNTWLVQSNDVYVPLIDGVNANGSTVYGSATTSLTISNLTLADGTNYEFIAANAFGTATSTPALLIMNSGTPTAPIITSQTPTASFGVLTNHAVQTTFSVTMDPASPPPLFFQWYNNLGAIPNATTANYVNVDTNNDTLYCVITNFVGAVTSSPVAITIYPKPAPSAYQSALLAYNPVAYWPLTEADGTVAFDYAGTNDGVYTGTYTLAQPGLPPTVGIGANTSVAFDGSTAYVDIPLGNLNITTAMTCIQWVQPPSGQTGFRTSLGHGDQSYRLSVVNGGGRFADPGADVVSPTLINDGNWHQLVGVYDGTNQYLYVDGQLSGTPHTGTPPGSTLHVWIGGAPDYAGARNFNGNIAQTAIIPSALSAAQVLAVYNSLGLPPTVSVAPVNPSIYAGSSVTLTASVGGTPPVKLQWYAIDTLSNSNNIAGATNATYTIANAPLSLNGYTYGVIASNVYGTNTASTVLTVQNGPAYLNGDISPLTGEAYVGAPVTYTVSAQGSLPIFYQWSVDGSPVSGATNASYTSPAACGSHTYQVSFTNAQNGAVPVISSTATLQGDANPTNITFNTDGTGWQLNAISAGPPTIVGNVLELTDGVGGEATSAFYTTPQYVGSFTTSFTYTGVGGADGVAFILQNSTAGATALGGSGGGLGYSGIRNSLALEINLYTGNGQNSGIAAGTNGNTYGAGGGAQYQPAGQVDVTSGNPIDFKINWANGVMSVAMKDTVTLATFATNYVYGELPPILAGSDLAYVGFSGGDGGVTSTQTISNFGFHSVIAPVALSVSPVTGGSFTISWPATDPSYVLQTTASLTTPSWGAGPTPVLVGGVYQATVNVNSSGQQFYRLIRVVCP